LREVRLVPGGAGQQADVINAAHSIDHEERPYN
jgi:hypothetical protein